MNYKIPLAKPSFSSLEKKLINQCLDSSWISSIGPFVEQFAQKLAKFVGIKYALAVDHGTNALHLALKALGIGPGDEVIVPALTFVATANAVSYTGATPVFVNIEPQTFNIDLTQIESAITKKTKAILTVDLYGHPVDYDRVRAICRRHQLHLISDAAESLGSLYKGKPTGSQADASIFSFFGNKIITTGEGGMLVTNNRRLYETARLYRDEGQNKAIHAYWHEVIGYNYGFTSLQAAVGIGQLKQLKKFVSRKRQIVVQYNRSLAHVSGLSSIQEADYAASNGWLYTLLVDRRRFGRSRDELMTILTKKGIETRPFFYPLPLLPPYKKPSFVKKFALTKKLADQGLNLPTYPDLTSKEIQLIVKAISLAYRQ